MANVREAPALSALRQRGFIESFAADGDELRVTGTGQRFRPEDVTIHDYYRFEGVSDPDDMSVIYALEASDGTRGVLIDAFGTYADPAVGALVDRMPTLRDGGGWSRTQRIVAACLFGAVALAAIAIVVARGRSRTAIDVPRDTGRRVWDRIVAAVPAIRRTAPATECTWRGRLDARRAARRGRTASLV